MQKFGFRIRSHTGLVVENLFVQAESAALAEEKIRKMYLRCTILECRALDDPASGNGLDLEDAISLILNQDRKS